MAKIAGPHILFRIGVDHLSKGLSATPRLRDLTPVAASVASDIIGGRLVGVSVDVKRISIELLSILGEDTLESLNALRDQVAERIRAVLMDRNAVPCSPPSSS